MTTCKILKETENGGLLIKDTTGKDRIVKTSHMFLSQFCIYSSRKHIDNTDDSSLLSRGTSGPEFCVIWLRKMPASGWQSLWESSSFVPCFPHLCSGMLPERFRNASVSVGSREIRLIYTERPKCGTLSGWTPGTVF